MVVRTVSDCRWQPTGSLALFEYEDDDDDNDVEEEEGYRTTPRETGDRPAGRSAGAAPVALVRASDVDIDDSCCVSETRSGKHVEFNSVELNFESAIAATSSVDLLRCTYCHSLRREVRV